MARQWQWLAAQFAVAVLALAAQEKSTAAADTPACDSVSIKVAQGLLACIKPGSGQSFKDCPDCPEMVVAPAGTFMMGSSQSEVDKLVKQYNNEDYKQEGPQHEVRFERPFAAGKYAVTFDEWGACVSDGGCGGYLPSDSFNWGRGRRPVIDVSWNDAKAYTAWLSTKTGKTYRLLSEAEREYVTRAGTKTPYWWGTAIDTEQANYNTNFTGGLGEKRMMTLPVDSLKPNPWGLYHVHGNLWEWVEDCYRNDYRNAPKDGSAVTDGECKYRDVRGGSWNDAPFALRAAFRDRYPPDIRTFILGVRIARDIAAGR
jgi:formylglycine-generating enzyme required for sulfatase activity